MSDPSVPERIESFVEQTDEDIDHIVVPAEDWDDVKEYDGTEVSGSGFDINHTIGGVPVRWRGMPQTETEAVVRITGDDE